MSHSDQLLQAVSDRFPDAAEGERAIALWRAVAASLVRLGALDAMARGRSAASLVDELYPLD